MAGFSAYLDNKLIDLTFGSGTFTKPSTLYLALTVSGTEVSGNGYVRKLVTFDISAGTATLHADTDYPVATGSWGTVDGAAVYDALTSGNKLANGTLTVPKDVTPGDIFRAPAGGVTITLA